MDIKEYMGKYKIKSEKTVYNHEKKGKIKLIRDENGKNTVIELQNELPKDNQTTINTEILVCKEEINTLKLTIKELENQIKYLDFEKIGREKYIELLEKENREKRDDIIRLQIQIEQMNQKEILLLETQIEQNKRKKWYQLWKN